MRAFQRGRALCGALALAFASATGAQAQTYHISSAGWTGHPGWVSGGTDEARLALSVLQGADGHGNAASLTADLFDPLQADTFPATDIARSSFDVAHLPGLGTLANAWPVALADDDWQSDPALRLKVLVPEGIDQAQARLVAAPQSVGAVPEPANWALMVGGFGMVGGIVRRHRTRPQVA